MGRNFLRRQILRNNKSPRTDYHGLIRCLFLLVLLAGGAFAAESEEVLFSRPLRNIESPGFPPHRAEYQFIENRILVPSALERPLVQHYIRHFSSPSGRAGLNTVMARGGPYLNFIRQEIVRRDLPWELLYLPVIESAFLATAVSRSGATGLWQFMMNSIAPFDIQVNEWVDERRDFWKSTHGALRKLQGNYNFFGCWNLALAAYNMGLGGLNRLMRSSGVNDYWELAERNLLSAETTHYVPRLLAVSYILSRPRQFGIEPHWPEDPRWERVPVNRSIDIRMLADEAGIDVDGLIWANRELNYNITPPGQRYYLKVPARYTERVTAVLKRTDIPLIRHYFHTIRSGDTLLALALHYGVSVDQILSANPGVEPRFLRIGSRLLIPALRDVAPFESPSPVRENMNFTGTHLVKQGETLWSIARAFEISPEMLAEANGMRLTDILRIGRVLNVPIR